MKLIRRILIISIVFAAFSVAIGYGMGSLWLIAPVFLIVGGGWVYFEWRGWDWPASIFLIGFVAACVFGMLLLLSPLIMLLGVLAALLSWDLDHMSRRLKGVHEECMAECMAKEHLLRLMLVNGCGLVLASAALLIRTQISFMGAIVLSVLVILGVGFTAGYLRRIA
jgi:hypothetical protein